MNAPATARWGDRYAAVVVAVSTGGIQALRRLLSALPGDFPLPIIVVLHTATSDGYGLCEVLQTHSTLPVTIAEIGDTPGPGVYLAPPGYHLLIERDHRFSLSIDDKVCFVRPSADVLFESAADAWTDRLIGIVLTGANDDGARGLRQLRLRGGHAIVQALDDAEMPSMPEAALRLAGADELVPLAAIAPRLVELASST
ncbi:chemotaxis protein CheB [Hydrocarboniphaga effusa]|jgi:two-component system chemotaxis response regulator CheB|uniref:chemotaxis protein CheB n=1 Tax=Hydrocarboniphaga effusa TaxID=243629 RepID=UPI0031377A9D